MKRKIFVLAIAAFVILAGCTLARRPAKEPTPVTEGEAAAPAASGLSPEAIAIAQERQLSPDDITAALKTYMPTGVHDEYVIFSSGGHSGQVLVIGVPSMRLLKVIGVFTPEPWQGWGYGVGEEILDEGNVNGKEIRSFHEISCNN